MAAACGVNTHNVGGQSMVPSGQEETNKRLRQQLLWKRQHPQSLHLTCVCVCLCLRYRQRERCTMYQAAASLTLSVIWTVGTQSDAPSTKGEQMGEPLIVHQVPVSLSVYMFYALVCLCVCYMHVPVQHIISPCGRLSSSSSCCRGQAAATGSEVMRTVVWGIRRPALCVCVEKTLGHLYNNAHLTPNCSIQHSGTYMSWLTAELSRVKVMHNAMFLTL